MDKWPSSTSDISVVIQMICDLYKEGFDWLYLYQAKPIYHLIMTWAYRAPWAGSAVVLVQSLPFDSRFRIFIR